MRRTCPILSCDASQKFVTTKHSYKLFRCTGCNIHYVYPQPSDATLAKIYSFANDYFICTDFDPSVENSAMIARLQYLGRLGITSGKFLDVGCGTGSNVHAAQSQGFEAMGIDLNPDIVKRGTAKGLRIYHKRLEELSEKPGSFSVIYLGDIIEHVKDPKNFLKRCNRLLRKGGAVMINTPNLNAFYPRYQRLLTRLFFIPWGHPSPPYHLFEFSDTNITKLLELTGFQVTHLSYDPIPLAYSIGNTGLFAQFKTHYRRTHSFFTSFKKAPRREKLLLLGAVPLYSAGFIIQKGINKFSKRKSSMYLVAVKRE